MAITVNKSTASDGNFDSFKFIKPFPFCMSDSGGSGPLTLTEAMRHFWLFSKVEIQYDWDAYFYNTSSEAWEFSASKSHTHLLWIYTSSGGGGGSSWSGTAPKNRRCTQQYLVVNNDAEDDYAAWDETIFKWSEGVGYRIDFGSDYIHFDWMTQSGDFEVHADFPNQGSTGYDDHDSASFSLWGQTYAIGFGLDKLGSYDWEMRNKSIDVTEYHYNAASFSSGYSSGFAV